MDHLCKWVQSVKNEVKQAPKGCQFEVGALKLLEFDIKIINIQVF